jgi:hypothetical protein
LSGWSLVMAALSITGLWLSTTWPRVGWSYSLASQVPWAVYGVLTGQPGMVVMSVVFAGFYCRALWRWRHTRLEPVRAPEPTA